MNILKTNIHFRPWVGDNYEKGIGGKRLLVLGESHYSDTDDPELTQTVMKKLFDYKLGAGEYESWMKTFTVFERAMTGRELSGEESVAFWNSVLFYNFIQEMLPGAGYRPTRKQFAGSAAAFDEVLNEYEPDLIITWGTALFDNTPALDGRDAPSIELDNNAIYTYEYVLLSGKHCKMLRMSHPSRNYSIVKWHEIISKFMS